MKAAVYVGDTTCLAVARLGAGPARLPALHRADRDRSPGHAREGVEEITREGVTDAENLIRQGIEVYPCDDASSDATISIAESYLGRGVIGIERLPHGAVYRWRRILERKEELCAALDADESHLPPPGHATLGEAFAEVERRGYDAAHCFEFTFIPTRESPDHDHRRFRSTLHSYYPFLPTFSALCAGMEATRRADGAGPLRAAHRALARRAGRACVAR